MGEITLPRVLPVDGIMLKRVKEPLLKEINMQTKIKNIPPNIKLVFALKNSITFSLTGNGKPMISLFFC